MIDTYNLKFDYRVTFYIFRLFVVIRSYSNSKLMNKNHCLLEMYELINLY